MDTIRFDHLTRVLTRTPTRRGVARALTGLALGGALATARSDDAAATKKKRKTCGPCQTRKKGKCKDKKPDETACNGDGKCFAGTCISRPACLVIGSDCTQPAADECCSGMCSADGDVCHFSGPGEPCYSFKDCAGTPVTTCIAYRCR